MTAKITPIKAIVTIILSACAGAMLCMNTIGIENFLLHILIIIISAVSLKIQQVRLPKARLFKAGSFLLALVWLMGHSFSIDNSLRSIVQSYRHIVKSAVYVVGATFFIYQLCRLLFLLLESSYKKQSDFIKKPFIFLLICWGIPVITCYPANLCNDVWNQLSQYFGFSAFTAHHPPVHTLIIGFFTQVGVWIGDANIGLYFFILAQTLIYALVLSYSFTLLKKLSAPGWLLFLSIITAGLSPYYANRVSLVLKDNLYSVAVLLFITELVYALLDFSGFLKSKKHICLWTLSVLGILLFRNNGKHILYPTVLVLLVILFKKRKVFSRQTVFQSLGLLFLPILFAGAINLAVTNSFGIQKGSIAEALSLPFQQTARCVWEHGSEITSEEQKAIGAVLDYANLATNYSPIISDPVKATFNRQSTTEDLIQYFKIWFKMFFKYPDTYISATVNQNYFLFYPFAENQAIYMEFNDFSEELMAPLKQEVGLHEVTIFDSAKVLLTKWFGLLHHTPIIGLFSNPAFYTLVFLFVVLLAIANKTYKLLIPALPIVLSVVVIILAPVIIGHPRYAFPIIYTLPVLLAYYMYLRRQTLN